MKHGAQDIPAIAPLSAIGKSHGKHGLVAEKTNDRPIQAQTDENRNADGDDRDIGGPIGQLEGRDSRL